MIKNKKDFLENIKSDDPFLIFSNGFVQNAGFKN